MSAVKYLWPTNRLRALVTQPGGKTRTAALAGVAEALEECRPDALEGIEESLAGIDAILKEATGGELSRDQVYAILQHTERLANIAMTFEFAAMSRVVSSLGELGMALLDAPSRPSHPIAVHARAARWAADNLEMSESQAEPVITGLLKVVGRFDSRTEASRSA